MMEYAKDEIFTIRYNVKKDELEYPIRKRIRDRIRNNKVIILFFMMSVVFTVLDITFIWYFLSLLTKI